MEMQVKYTLTGLFADIGDYAITVQTKFFGHFGDDSKNVANDGGVVLVYGRDGSDMGFGDNQKVSGCLRVDVIECVAQFILIYLVGRDVAGDDFTE